MTHFSMHILALIMIGGSFFQVLAIPFYTEHRGNAEPTESEIHTMHPPVPLQEIEIGAWIYPGKPACNALHELADGRKVDVVKSEYFRIDEQGKLLLLTEAEHGCNAFSTTNIQETKKHSREQYVTISSPDSDKMDLFLTEALIDPALRKYLIDFVVESGLTGVELDFEDFGKWSPEIYKKYTQFVTLLGTDLHQQQKKLLIAGPAISNEMEQSWYAWRYEDFDTLPVDRLIVMTYDYQYDQGVGHAISPNFWIKNVIAWSLKKVSDPTRISIGIPSYGYEGTSGSLKIKLLTFEEIQEKPGFDGATRDPESAEMTWKNKDRVYFYQDSLSMQQKLETIRAEGISAVSVWHLGGNLWFAK